MLQILGQLQSGNGLNADQLAGQLDVCRRTIFRDLNMMREAGIGLYFDGDTDCYRLAPRNDLVVAPTLEHEELTTLIAAVHLSVLRSLPECRDVLRRSTSKLLARSPRHVQHHVTRLTNSCTVRSAIDHYSSRATRFVHLILQAITQRRMLRITLVDTDGGREIETRFAPYQMIAAADTWQVIGRSSHHRGVRTFDPRNMKRSEMTDDIYAIPRHFQSPS